MDKQINSRTAKQICLTQFTLLKVKLSVYGKRFSKNLYSSNIIFRR